jgi:hypothetical protein
MITVPRPETTASVKKERERRLCLDNEVNNLPRRTPETPIKKRAHDQYASADESLTLKKKHDSQVHTNTPDKNVGKKR